MDINQGHTLTNAGTNVAENVWADAPHVGALPMEQLKPLLAGARARGMADAFDMMHMAAILFDGCGMILHCNGTAKLSLGHGLTIAHRHLLGHDAATSRNLQDLIAAAVGESAQPGKLEIVAGSTGKNFEVEIVPVPNAAVDSCQLLKAIAIIR